MKFTDIYPDYEEEEYLGTIFYMVKVPVGGRDERGEFELIQDGPAQGERVYLNE